jgi:hypothetical protein
MSMSYKVNFKVSQTVRSGDKASQKIDLRPVLAQEDMKALLRQKLTEQGYEQDPSDPDIVKKEVTDPVTGITTTHKVDTRSMEATTEAVAESKVEEEIEARGYDDVKGSIERSRDQQQEALIKSRTKELDAKVNDAVAKGAADTAKHVSAALEGTYAEALKTKARQMGDVVEQTEGTNSEGDYELVILVEV